MGSQLRMHSEVRDWLTGLRGAEPGLARLVGEAVLAVLDAGGGLGPPLVVPLGSMLRRPDPGDALDYSYQRLLEALTAVRRGVADVATSRKRVELQTSQLEQTAAKLASQLGDAVEAGREDLASEARIREARAQEQLSELRHGLLSLTGEEERLTAVSQRLQAKVDAFRTHKETIKATYTADRAWQTVREAFAGIDGDASHLDVANAEAGSASGLSGVSGLGGSSGLSGASAAAHELAQEIRDVTPGSPGRSGPADRGDVQPPPGMMELRPGAPDNVRVGLLFVLEPQDTVILVACVEDAGGPPAEYQDVMRIATARLAIAQPAGPPAAEDSAVAFISYDAESFLDEFFPGEETEVEIGAGALVARNRAHTLAEARQRMRLTQAQVAGRMQVRQERVSAIERAEPGATEVRTLAAYVGALGGRLEIIADMGGERIMLK